MKTSNLRLAIQKSGRLNQDSIKLLDQCGIKVSNGGSLRAEASNFAMEVLYLRDDDIPQYVADGVADIGIVGENVQLESGFDVAIKEKLGFGKCRLSLAVPRETTYTGLEWFRGKRIATSYPLILKNFLDEQSLDSKIEAISGSVEIAPGIGLAEAICDLVSTGSTLLINGLKEVHTLLKSEAVLVANRELPTEKKAILEKLQFRIEAVRNASRFKYILLNAPLDCVDAISAILPSMKSPTILPLAENGWCSLHSVVMEDDFWEVIEALKSAGAEGILVCPIEKMIR